MGNAYKLVGISFLIKLNAQNVYVHVPIFIWFKFVDKLVWWLFDNI